MKIRYLLFLLFFLLVGCSNVAINKETFVKKIDANFNNILMVSNQELESYDIDISKFKDFVFKITNDNKYLYILVLPTNKKEAEKEIEKFLNKKKINNYYDNTFGDYLFYIVSDNNKNIYKEMKEFVNKK